MKKQENARQVMREKIKTLPVSETFYSLQGEGVTTGVPAVFLRLGGCNLICGGKGTQKDKELHNGATWRCDTIEVWMKSQAIQFKDILDAQLVKQLQNGAHLIVTGGEPLLHLDRLVEYLQYLHSRVKGLFVEVETNGTITPTVQLTKLVNQFNVSPKLQNSGNSYAEMRNVTALQTFALCQNTWFKFVVSDASDWAEITTMYGAYIRQDQVVIMPAGETQNELDVTRPIVAALCKKVGLRMCSRMHIEIWNKKTGV